MASQRSARQAGYPPCGPPAEQSMRQIVEKKMLEARVMAPTQNIIHKLADVYAFSAVKAFLENVDKEISDRKTSHVEFVEGDKVWLSTEHLLIRKFRQRYIGPYPVTAKISSHAYRLRLPPTFDSHNVVHISRLRQCVNPYAQPDTIPSCVEPRVDEFIVERVLDFSIERREDLFKRGLCLVFLVRWLNYE
eukprot:jgi/Tetstr1/454462/TSEL_041362.t1